MADIGALVVRISADASSLAKELDNISKGGSKAAAGIQNAGKIMSTAIIAVGSAAVAATLHIARQTEETQQLSQKTGIAIQTLQSWSVIMAENSLNGQQLAMATKTLSKEMVAAQDPASAAAAAFDSLGISVTQLGSTEDVIKGIADKFAAMPDGAEKSALAVQLFGKAGLDMIPTLNKGAKAFDDSAEAARRFGLVLTNEQVNALTSVDDSVDRLGQALKGLETAFAVTFAPWIEAAVKALTDTISSLRLSIASLTGEVERTHGAQWYLGMEIVKQTLADIKAYEAEAGAAEEKLGRKMRDRFIREQMFINANKKAQEELGRSIVRQTQTQLAEKAAFPGVNVATPEGNKGLLIVQQTQKALQNNLQIEQQENAELLRRIEIGEMFESTIEQQQKQEQLGAQIVQKSVHDYEKRFSALENEAELRKDIHEEQLLYYQQDSDFSDKADIARRTAMEAIDAQARLTTARLKEQLEQQKIDEEQYAEEIERIRRRTENQKRQVAQEFPGFWEKQLNDLQASNVFSMGAMVSTWSNAIATMIVKGGDLRQAWEATKIAIVQAFIQMGVAAAASAVKTMVMNEVAAGGVTAIWAGVGAFITGLWATVTGAIGSMFATLVGIMTAVGEAIMGVLTAIAEALIDTVFGSAWGVAILAGVIAIGVALGALAAVGVFAEGGVVTGPMLGLVGEAGPEAIIPLDRMKDFGGGAERQTVVQLSIDGKKFMRAVARHTGSAWRSEGAPA